MDIRDAESLHGSWYEEFDEKRMVLKVELFNDEGDIELVEVPAKYEVCALCNGKGSHVNPSIDAHGITAEEFDEDPYFAEDYMQGAYDVPCYRCEGTRVEPTVNTKLVSKDTLRRIRELWADQALDRREREAEARWAY
jgi:hypothetical protein